jgi:hypothetical protein
MCGSWPDINIYRLKMKQMLAPGEMVVADRGYRGDPTVHNPDSRVSRTDSRAMSKARARMETVNGHLKNWKVLSSRFWHPMYKHGQCFRAVAVCEQLTFNRSDRPYKVTY